MSDGGDLEMTIETELEWHGEELLTQARAAMRDRLVAAALIVGNHAKRLVSSRYPPASAPGDPPALRTGQGRASIGYRTSADSRTVEPVPIPQESAEGVSVMVGSAVDHMVYLELGTATIAPRPWLRRAAVEMRERVRDVLKGGQDSGLETSDS